jgi:site-specific DNA-methyltransferase (adenine-specific)
MPDNSVDSIVTDPPYELGFMGKKWDSSGIAYDQTLWAECLRVLKPGGHLIAFGGTRTYHRMTCAIEDAGFEIRDCIQWIYGSGFPKSHNLDGDWHGFGTALKPANEPAVLARKPLSGTVADNVMTWGVGALNIDGCRVGSSGGTQWVSDGAQGDEGQFGGGIKDGKIASINAGRWPANVIFDEEAAQMLDAQSGHSVSKPHIQYKKAMKSIAKGYESARIDKVDYSDSGGASRFFYVAKASRAEREAGLDGMEVQRRAGLQGSDRDGEIDPLSERWRTSPRANHHPTVKPITLMRYLVRLVTPPGGVVLDPFMGSGSTGCAAMLEAMQFIGIELSAEYLEIARRRILHHANQNPMGL